MMLFNIRIASLHRPNPHLALMRQNQMATKRFPKQVYTYAKLKCKVVAPTGTRYLVQVTRDESQTGLPIPIFPDLFCAFVFTLVRAWYGNIRTW